MRHDDLVGFEFDAELPPGGSTRWRVTGTAEWSDQYVVVENEHGHRSARRADLVRIVKGSG